MLHLLDTLVANLIAHVVRRAGLWVGGYAIAFVLSVAASVGFLGVNTDSSQMLAASLPFQEKTQAFNRDFPSIKNSVVIVVRADIADAADAATQAIVENLQASDKATNVFAPSVDSFFLANGLLYQDADTLQSNLDQLNKSASLLAKLRAEPTLESFLLSLYTAEELGAGAEFDLSYLDDFYSDVTATIEGRLAGRFSPLSWAKTADSKARGENGKNEQVQRLIYASPVLDFSAIQPAKAALSAIDTAIASIPDDVRTIVTVAVTGDPVLRFEELQSVSSGIGLSFALSLLLVGILLLVALRSLPHVVLTFVALVVSLALSTGFAAVAFGELNLVSVAFIVLLVGLGLDFTIHALAHLNDETHTLPGDALVATGRSLGGALFLSALTTAIAFLSFVPTDFTGMMQLGVLGAAGVTIAFLVAITLVPALIVRVAWFNPKTGGRTRPQRRAILPAVMIRLRIPAALGLAALGVAAAFYAGGVHFDADPIALRDPESPSMRALALLQERPDTVPYRLSLLRGDEQAAIGAAEAVSKLATVESARTLSDLVPKNQDQKLELIDLAIPTFDTIVSGEGLDHAALPEGKTPLEALRDRLAPLEKRQKAVRFAALLDRLMRAPDGMKDTVEGDIFRFFPRLIETIEAQLSVDRVTLDNLPPFFTGRFRGEDGRWRVDVVPREDLRDPAALKRFVESVEAFDPEAVGVPLQIAKAGDVVSRAMATALILASVLIMTISFAVLHRPSLVLAVFLPLVLAGLLTAGASVFFGIPFNYANVIVLPLLIGLGVDSGIHVAVKRERLQNSAELYATSTPRAVLFSGLTTIAAFATLGVSAHRGTASMGQMLAIAISVTLVSSMVFTPILMDFFAKLKKSR